MTTGFAAKKAGDVAVTHLPLRESAKADTTYESKGISAQDVYVEKVADNDLSAKGANTIVLDTDSFSVYAFSYTVDFTYDGFTYSIAGESSIALRKLEVETPDGVRRVSINATKVKRIKKAGEHLVLYVVHGYVAAYERLT